MAAVSAVASGVAASSTAATVAAGAFIGASIGFGYAVADAVTSSTSASDSANRGGSALASTASGAEFGGAYGYSVAGTRNNTATRSSKLDRYVKNPQKLQNVSPAKIEKIAMKENLQIGTLSKGAHAGQGMKVTWGGDKLLQFHPGGGHHGPNSYWKVSSGETGTIRIFNDK